MTIGFSREKRDATLTGLYVTLAPGRCLFGGYWMGSILMALAIPLRYFRAAVSLLIIDMVGVDSRAW